MAEYGVAHVLAELDFLLFKEENCMVEGADPNYVHDLLARIHSVIDETLFTDKEVKEGLTDLQLHIWMGWLGQSNRPEFREQNSQKILDLMKDRKRREAKQDDR